MPPFEPTLELYGCLTQLEQRFGGARRLSDATGRMLWPERGVFFLFEAGERRAGSGVGSRVVHVGTHGLRKRTQATLWSCLRRHRGTPNMTGGNHRASTLRKLIGEALMAQNPALEVRTWGQGRLLPPHLRGAEHELERMVSQRILQMRTVCLPINDAPAPDSLRAYVQCNAVALLSGRDGGGRNSPSTHWLGRHSPRESVRRSGLWADRLPDRPVDSGFFKVLRELVEGDVRYVG